MHSSHYTEEQRFWTPLYVLVIAAVMIPAAYTLYELIQDGFDSVLESEDGVGSLIGVVIGIALPIFFYFLRLVVEVRDDGVYYRVAPFQLRFKRLGFDEIASFEVVSYRPLREYGGWGIRRIKGGVAYSARGTRGLKFLKLDGTHLLIGSQQVEQFENVLYSLRVKRRG